MILTHFARYWINMGKGGGAQNFSKVSRTAKAFPTRRIRGPAPSEHFETYNPRNAISSILGDFEILQNSEDYRVPR